MKVKLFKGWELVAVLVLAVVAVYILYPVQIRGKVVFTQAYGQGQYVVGVMPSDGGVFLVDVPRGVYEEAVRNKGTVMSVRSKRW